MDNILMTVVFLLVGAGAGFIAASAMKKSASEQKEREAGESAKRMIEQARIQAETIKKESDLAAMDRILAAKTEMEEELKERRNELGRMERRLAQKEEHLERKAEQLDKREQDMGKREKDIRKAETAVGEKTAEAERLVSDQRTALEHVSGLTADEAKREILRRVEDETRFEAAKLAKRIEEEATEEAVRNGKKILSLAIERYASDYAADATVSAVTLPSDEMKGRIIGREGRNIRALEAATGVDLIIDDTPESVVISSFDPVRRQVAKVSLEKLIADGRIHPARIEELVEKSRKEIDQNMKEEGEKALFDLGLHGIHPELVKLLGRLKYRTSYGQNGLQHSREVAYLAGIMASELGVDTKLAKRAGLLHDIGKALDHEIEGTHMAIGVDVAKKYGENAKVLNAIASHHGDEDPNCIESSLVAAADALSAARPGARRESLEHYMKRLEKLEELAKSFKGVSKCYAIQAGREIRVIVRPEDTTDEACYMISRDLAKRIETEMSYPGQIKVTVIRESRHVEYAK